MGKPIRERLAKPSYWYADQLPHWAIGLGLAFGVSFPWAWETSHVIAPQLVGIFFSDAVCTARELIQNWGDAPNEGSVEDTTIDGAFWRLGAYLGAIPSIFV